MKWAQLYGSLDILWHFLSLRLEWKLTFSVFKTDFSSPVVTAEFSRFGVIEFSPLTASSSRTINSLAEIPSSSLALFAVMFLKAHLTSHSRMCGCRWVTMFCQNPSLWSVCLGWPCSVAWLIASLSYASSFTTHGKTIIHEGDYRPAFLLISSLWHLIQTKWNSRDKIYLPAWNSWQNLWKWFLRHWPLGDKGQWSWRNRKQMRRHLQLPQLAFLREFLDHGFTGEIFQTLYGKYC